MFDADGVVIKHGTFFVRGDHCHALAQCILVLLDQYKGSVVGCRSPVNLVV